MNFVAFVLEPTEDDGSIEAAGVGEDAGGHRKPEVRGQKSEVRHLTTV
jgi:hypothetical protein